MSAPVVLQRRYVLEHVVGRGGMAVVYQATDRLLQRPVAVKKILTEELEDDETLSALAAFRAEVRMLSHLSHPRVVTILDCFVANGTPYIVMPLISGASVGRILRRHTEPLPIGTVLAWGDQICEALHYLHNLPTPILLRDLKPDNLMYSPGHGMVVIDFGIARLFERGSTTGTAFKGLGTAGYSPPEQMTSTTDTRSDIYSLGATLYVLATREVPPHSLFLQIGNMHLEPPHALNPAVPETLSDIILQAMALDPNERFQNVQALRQALREVPCDTPRLVDLPGLSVAPPAPRRSMREEQPQLAAAGLPVAAEAACLTARLLPAVPRCIEHGTELIGPWPGTLRHFRGRTAQMDAIDAAMQSRIIQVDGAAGAGKTALVRLWLQRLTARSRLDMALYVPLRQPSWQAPATWLMLLGAHEGLQIEDRLQHFLDRLQRSLVIVLDQVETLVDSAGQLIPAARDVATVLQAIRNTERPVCVVLITRRRLPWTIDTISVPPEVEPHEAAAILAALAPNAPPMLAERLQYVPRHIEAAVCMVRSDMATSYEALLNDAPALYRLIGDAAGETYRMLTPGQRQIVHLLAVHNRSVSLEAISDALPGFDIRPVLEVLVENHVVLRDGRGYALRRSDQAYVYRQLPNVDGGGGRPALHSLAASFYRKHRHADPRSVEQLDAWLQEFHHLYAGGMYDAASAVLSDIDVRYLHPLGLGPQACSWRLQLMEVLTHPVQRRLNLGRLGTLYRLAGHPQNARPLLEQAVSESETAGDPMAAAQWRRQLAAALVDLGLAQEASRLVRVIPAPHDAAEARLHTVTLKLLARLEYDAGRLQRCKELEEEALHLARLHGMDDLEGSLLGALGSTYSALGQPWPGLACKQYALLAAQNRGRRLEEAVWLCNIGSSYLELGLLEDAENALRNSLEIAQELGLMGEQASASLNLGLVQQERGHHGDALTWLESARGLAEEAGSPALVATVGSFLGGALVEVGRFDEAADVLAECIEDAAEMHMRAEELLASAHRARLSAWREEPGVTRWMERVKALVNALPHTPIRAWSGWLLSQVLLLRTESRRAGAQLRWALKMALQVESLHLVARCHAALGQHYYEAGQWVHAAEHLLKAADSPYPAAALPAAVRLGLMGPEHESWLHRAVGMSGPLVRSGSPALEVVLYRMVAQSALERTAEAEALRARLSESAPAPGLYSIGSDLLERIGKVFQGA